MVWHVDLLQVSHQGLALRPLFVLSPDGLAVRPILVRPVSSATRWLARSPDVVRLLKPGLVPSSCRILCRYYSTAPIFSRFPSVSQQAEAAALHGYFRAGAFHSGALQMHLSSGASVLLLCFAELLFRDDIPFGERLRLAVLFQFPVSYLS